MSEFVEGFEKLSRIGPCVSIFGSARTTPENKYYKLAEDIAYKLVQNGYGVITGGGPGIMEAANLGAKKGNAKTESLEYFTLSKRRIKKIRCKCRISKTGETILNEKQRLLR